METITIIGAMGGMIITTMLMLRSDIRQSEKRMVGMIQQNEERAKSDVATLRSEIRQSEERTVEMIQQSEKRTVEMIQQSEKRTVEMIQQSEERTQRAIQDSEKQQDVLRKAELEPIKAELGSVKDQLDSVKDQLESVKDQIEPIKAHIEPIKEQVYNHIPTQINELRSIIVEYIVKGTAESKNITPPHHKDDEPTTPH